MSVCMLTILLYACTKSDRGPLDCMGIENGVAALDECGNCHGDGFADTLDGDCVVGGPGESWLPGCNDGVDNALVAKKYLPRT